MGNNVSVEERVYKVAKNGETSELASIINQIHRQGQDVKRYLAFEDGSGQTPLIVACYRGNVACVDLVEFPSAASATNIVSLATLPTSYKISRSAEIKHFWSRQLQSRTSAFLWILTFWAHSLSLLQMPLAIRLLKHGANVSHVTHAPERNTALHEAVNRGQVQIAELLMRFGANPFLENGRGLTSVDAAINRQNTHLLRSLEMRSDFTATLQLKVPRFMGLGAEWKDRWCVVMPRYQLATGRTTVARLLFVCYKDATSCIPSCKVWLDGSIARQVVGSQGAAVLQCALSLHKNHALAANVHMTGDSAIGYTMHLRPKSQAPQSTQALHRFMELVNGSRQPATSPSGSAAQTPQASRLSRPPPNLPQPAAQQLREDEELARALQATYNQEWSDHKCPPVNLNDRVPQPYGSNAPAAQSGYPEGNASSSGQAYHQHHNSAQSSASLHSIPSAPLYPDINLASSAPTAQAPTGSQPASTEGFGASLDWYRANAAPASVPPPTASQAAPGVPSKSDNVNGEQPAAGEDDDAGTCVICLESPATAGFLHGESVHKCCCRECAKELKKSRLPACPMCRQPIEHVILNFY